jgi:hypothetical protein
LDPEEGAEEGEGEGGREGGREGGAVVATLRLSLLLDQAPLLLPSLLSVLHDRLRCLAPPYPLPSQSSLPPSLPPSLGQAGGEGSGGLTEGKGEGEREEGREGGERRVEEAEKMVTSCLKWMREPSLTSLWGRYCPEPFPKLREIAEFLSGALKHGEGGRAGGRAGGRRLLLLLQALMRDMELVPMEASG